MMGNFGSTLAKVAALAGGAVVGAWLAGWLDKVITTQARERADLDRTRYEQGLTPVAPAPATDERPQ